METICNGIGQGHITDEDVERALRPIITSSEKNLRTAAYWLSNLSKLQSDPMQLQMIRDLKEDLQSITAEEIRELAKGQADLWICSEDYMICASKGV